MWDYIVGDPARGIAPGRCSSTSGKRSARRLIGFPERSSSVIPIGILMGRYRYAKSFFFDMVYLAANVPLIVYAILGILLTSGSVASVRHSSSRSRCSP